MAEWSVRYIILDLTVYEQRLTLVCLYGYNTDKPELFTEILQKFVLPFDCYIFGTMCLLKTNYGDFLCLNPIKYI
jgi:hypothetical protein